MGFLKLMGVLFVFFLLFGTWRLCAEAGKADEQIARMFHHDEEK